MPDWDLTAQGVRIFPFFFFAQSAEESDCLYPEGRRAEEPRRGDGDARLFQPDACESPVEYPVAEQEVMEDGSIKLTMVMDSKRIDGQRMW